MTAIKTPFDWVALATAGDKERAALQGYSADESHVAATDGYRLHMAPRKLADAVPAGLRDPKTFQPIEGTFPDWHRLMPGLNGTPLHETYVDVLDVEHMRAMCAAGIAANKSIRAAKDADYGYKIILRSEGVDRAVKPHYLLDALKAGESDRYEPGTFSIGFGKVDGPVHVRHSSGAEAIIMPIRREVQLDKRCIIVDIDR